MSEAGLVLATGYNGVASGIPHCNALVSSTILYADARSQDPLLTYPHACHGAGLPSGTGLDSCEATHAEANSLLQCRDVRQVHTAYVTASPCLSCTKLLLNTGCRRVVFREVYPHPASQELWFKGPGERFWLHQPRIEHA